MRALSDLVGMDEPLSPADVQFRAVLARVWLPLRTDKPERACQGCIFKGQRAKVCVQASAAARLSGMPDCEERDRATGKTYIYELIPIDTRQQGLF